MARKKTVSGWKSKKTYAVLAPEAFERKEMGVTVADDPEKIKGRTVSTSLGGLTGDRSKNYLNLVFEVKDVKGDSALTKFRKFFIPVGYLRSKVRKRTKKIDYVRDVPMDGEKVRVKIMVLSRHKVSDVQKDEIKAKITEAVDAHAKDTLDNLVQQTLFGKFGTEIYKTIKTVCPIMRVEVYGIETLK